MVEVDVIVFVVDGCVGFMFGDCVIVECLCRLKIKVFVVVNKIEGM